MDRQPAGLAPAGCLYLIKRDDGLAAAIIGIDVVGDHADLQVPLSAEGTRTLAGDVKILGQNEFHAPDENVAARREAVRGKCERLHAALILHAVLVNLSENHCEGDALAGTDVLHRDVELDDASERFEIRVPQVDEDGILTAADCHVDGRRAFFGVDDGAAVHPDGRVREGHRVALRVGIFDIEIDKLGAAGISRMADEKLKRGTLVSGHAEGVDFPLQLMCVHRHGAALIGRADADDGKVAVDLLVNHDLRRARLRDVDREIGEQLLQIGGVRRHRDVGGVGIGRPLVERIGVDAVRTHQADAVDHNAGRPRCGGDGSRRRTGRRLSVGKHDDHLRVRRRGIEEVHRLAERSSVVRRSAGREAIHRRLERIDGRDELRVRDGVLREADNADPAAGADAAVLTRIRRLVDDVDEGFRAELQVGKRRPRHAAGAVEDEDDVRGT